MKKVTDFLGHAIAGQDVLKAARAKTVLRNWEEIVGSYLSKKVTVDKYDHGTLFLIADGSAWAQEARLNAETILTRLNEEAGESGLFTRIRVSVSQAN